jgi:putative acetyltransferase
MTSPPAEESDARARIVPFEDHHAGDFKRLNLEWLEGHGLLEPGDLVYLDAPRTSILDRGGRILIAEWGGAVVGTCALVPRGEGVVELLKLAVDGSARGRGIGRRLMDEALAEARRMGATSVTLVSSSRLASALRLYEAVGFRHVPPPREVEYATADVFMELRLGPGPPR